MSAARTWKCPECGHHEKIDYDWLAEHGEPVCNKCDCNMKLEPEVDVQLLDRLVNRVESAGLEPEDLDETVHELASSIAADINNSGPEDQLRYLLSEMGVKATERELAKLIEEHTKEDEE